MIFSAVYLFQICSALEFLSCPTAFSLRFDFTQRFRRVFKRAQFLLQPAVLVTIFNYLTDLLTDQSS